MQGPETRLRRRIVEALRKQYPRGLFLKIHGGAYQNIGIPDLLCCVNGHFVGMEIKIPRRKNKASPAQLCMINDIRKAGGRADVITSVEEAIDLVRNLTGGNIHDV